MFEATAQLGTENNTLAYEGIYLVYRYHQGMLFSKYQVNLWAQAEGFNPFVEAISLSGDLTDTDYNDLGQLVTKYGQPDKVVLLEGESPSYSIWSRHGIAVRVNNASRVENSEWNSVSVTEVILFEPRPFRQLLYFKPPWFDSIR